MRRGWRRREGEEEAEGAVGVPARRARGAAVATTLAEATLPKEAREEVTAPAAVAREDGGMVDALRKARRKIRGK